MCVKLRVHYLVSTAKIKRDLPVRLAVNFDNMMLVYRIDNLWPCVLGQVGT